MAWLMLIAAGCCEMFGVAMIGRLHRDRNWQAVALLVLRIRRQLSAAVAGHGKSPDGYGLCGMDRDRCFRWSDSGHAALW